MEQTSITWIPPITDRTLADVATGTPKAYIHAEDLRRIEGNIAYLSKYLNSRRYGVKAFPAKLWLRENIPTTNDIRRICDRIKAIVEAYYRPDVYVDISDLFNRRLTASDMNNVERNLLGIKTLLEMGIHYNTHFCLSKRTHSNIRTHTHNQLRKNQGG